MTFLLLVTQPPVCSAIHRYVLDLIDAIYMAEHQVRAVFFTSAAAVLADSSHHHEFRVNYLEKSCNFNFPLLVCGRAFRDSGLRPELLENGFELSGNMELTVMLQECDKTVEF